MPVSSFKIDTRCISFLHRVQLLLLVMTVVDNSFRLAFCYCLCIFSWLLGVQFIISLTFNGFCQAEADLLERVLDFLAETLPAAKEQNSDSKMYAGLIFCTIWTNFTYLHFCFRTDYIYSCQSSFGGFDVLVFIFPCVKWNRIRHSHLENVTQFGVAPPGWLLPDTHQFHSVYPQSLLLLMLLLLFL